MSQRNVSKKDGVPCQRVALLLVMARIQHAAEVHIDERTEDMNLARAIVRKKVHRHESVTSVLGSSVSDFHVPGRLALHSHAVVKGYEDEAPKEHVSLVRSSASVKYDGSVDMNVSFPASFQQLQEKDEENREVECYPGSGDYQYFRLSNGGAVFGTSTNCDKEWQSWDLYAVKFYNFIGAPVNADAIKSSKPKGESTKEKACDGDPKTFFAGDPKSVKLSSNCWSDDKKDAQWITFQLGDRIPLSKIEVVQSSKNTDYNLGEIRYDCSADGVSWTAKTTVGILPVKGAAALFQAQKCSAWDCPKGYKAKEQSVWFCAGSRCGQDSDKEACCIEVKTKKTTPKPIPTTTPVAVVVKNNAMPKQIAQSLFLAIGSIVVSV